MCVCVIHMAKENMELYVRVLFPRCPCSSEKAAGICFACGAALRSGSDVGRYTLAQSSCSSLSPRCWMMLRSGLSASLSSSSTQKKQLFESVGTVMLKQGLEETVTTVVEARCCLTQLSQVITGCGLRVWTRGVNFYSLKKVWKCTVLQESHKATPSVISTDNYCTVARMSAC